MVDDHALRIRIYYERLQSLLNQVNSTNLESGRPSGMNVLTYHFDTLHNHVRTIAKDDRLIQDVIKDVHYINPVDEEGGIAVQIDAKQELIFGINCLLQALGTRLFSAAGAPATVSIDREGLFVAGQRFDALLAATRVLSSAQRTIVLVDGYISHHVLDLLSAKAETATVSIITKPATLPGNIGTLATAFNQQYGQKGPLSIRTSNAFHDRFLVIDDDQFYHFGASLKDLGERGFMFSRIEEPAMIDTLRKNIADEWAKGTVVV